MNDRILVTYATRTGSTAEVATSMADALTQHNLLVDLVPVKEVQDISGYRSIVLGSGIRIGSFLPEVMGFLEENQKSLGKVPLHVFLLCMTLHQDNPENRKVVNGYMEPVRTLIQPASEGMFAGVIDLSKMNFFDRIITKALNSPEGDFRNWDVINKWTAQIA